MCESCSHTNTAGVRFPDPGVSVRANTNLPSPTRVDPTRTLALRNAFVAQMNRRFRPVKGIVNKALITRDVLGLRESPHLAIFEEIPALTVPQPRAFQFRSDEAKLASFMAWLREQEEKGILQILTSGVAEAGKPWTNKYIQDAYTKGIIHARTQMSRIEPDAVTAAYPVEMALTAPVHASRVALIYSRVFSDLKGVTAAMDTEITRVLSEGMALGKNPRDIARDINNRIDKIGITRAKTLARTETIRAHHLATIQEYREMGVEGVHVVAEWMTARDSRVCPLCAPLEGRVFTLDEIEGMLPRHPNCRCTTVPVIL